MHQFHRPIRGPEPSGSNLRQAQGDRSWSTASFIKLLSF
jgi:hypothetical protein